MNKSIAAKQTVFIEYSGGHIPVEVGFRDRKRLSISVHPDCSVTALAPAGRSMEQVLSHLKRRAAWIARQRRHFGQYQPLPAPKRFVAGETHLYLGRQYRLRIRKSADTSVKLSGQFFQVQLPEPSTPQDVEALLVGWYRDHALQVFGDRLRRCASRIRTLEHHEIGVQIRSMKRRWGSCSKAGVITLNLELIKTPLHCVEYVIMHELCHLKVHDHGPAFFRLLGRCMPDWQSRKERLDSIVPR